MKTLTTTVISSTLILAFQPVGAQKINGMPILEMIFQTMDNISQARDTIQKNCKFSSYGKNNNKFFNILRIEASRSKVTPLNENQKINKLITDCKRQLKRNRSNTQRINGIFLLIEKALASTKKESFALKSLGPSAAFMNKIFQQSK
jgi:hypothetical protein